MLKAAVRHRSEDLSYTSAAAIATEFVGSSITSNDVDYAAVSRDLLHNPHVSYFGSRWHGYLLCEATPRPWRTDYGV